MVRAAVPAKMIFPSFIAISRVFPYARQAAVAGLVPAKTHERDHGADDCGNRCIQSTNRAFQRHPTTRPGSYPPIVRIAPLIQLNALSPPRNVAGPECGTIPAKLIHTSAVLTCLPGPGTL